MTSTLVWGDLSTVTRVLPFCPCMYCVLHVSDEMRVTRKGLREVLYFISPVWKTVHDIAITSACWFPVSLAELLNCFIYRDETYLVDRSSVELIPCDDFFLIFFFFACQRLWLELKIVVVFVFRAKYFFMRLGTQINLAVKWCLLMCGIIICMYNFTDMSLFMLALVHCGRITNIHRPIAIIPNLLATSRQVHSSISWLILTNQTLRQWLLVRVRRDFQNGFWTFSALITDSDLSTKDNQHKGISPALYSCRAFL